MNVTLLKAPFALVPACMLFSGSVALSFRRKTVSSFTGTPVTANAQVRNLSVEAKACVMLESRGANKPGALHNPYMGERVPLLPMPKPRMETSRYPLRNAS